MFGVCYVYYSKRWIVSYCKVMLGKCVCNVKKLCENVRDLFNVFGYFKFNVK